jgi:uncharacterized protein YwqG
MGLFDFLRSDMEKRFKRKLEKIDQYSKQAIHLAENKEHSFSKFGGKPNLGKNFEWPRFNDLPLSFLAQLKLSEIKANNILPNLPEQGLLFIFYVQDQSTWGFDPKDKGSWKLIFNPDESKMDEESEFPEDMTEEGKFQEKFIKGKIIKTFPSWEDARIEKLKFSEEEFEMYDDFKINQFNNEYQNQLGGYPNPIQNPDMHIECQLVTNGIYLGDAKGYQNPKSKEILKEKNDWQLLLQIDSDESIGMMWGDSGKLYFWIRQDDLINCNFENTWMILQCG